MNHQYVQLGAGEVALSALLLLVNVALSFALRLNLGARLVVAAARMTVQLLLIGQVLNWIFEQENPWIILAMACVMGALAGTSAVGRTSRRFVGIYRDSLVSVMGSAFLVTGLTLGVVLDVSPWYAPRYLVPLLGMVLGNALSGITLATDRFMEGVAERAPAIEALLALGATRWEAALGEIRHALRLGMIPTLNSMAVMGLVSLPGMMTGQILSGTAPSEAVRYQLVIMFMIASAAALAIVSMVLLAFRTLFDGDHRLRVDRLRPAESAWASLRRWRRERFRQPGG